MADGSIEASIFGGPEASAMKLELSEDALGLGRAVEGLAREIRKGPEGLLDRADRFYQLTQILFPVRAAKRDAKALALRAEALRDAAATLSASPPDGIAATRMMIADYSRRYQNIDETIIRALPMIDADASPEMISDDWLGFAFDNIGSVSEPAVQELWARLLAQEANRPGRVPRRAAAKLSLMDRQSTIVLRKLLRNTVTLYMPNHRREAGTGGQLYKIGRFVFPALIEMLSWGGVDPGDDFEVHHGRTRDGMDGEGRRVVRWLTEESLLREVPSDLLRTGYLDVQQWPRGGWKPAEPFWPLAIRVGMGKTFECDVRDFNEMVRKYSNGGATTQVLQLTDLAEALLDPRIRQPAVVKESVIRGDDWKPGRKTVRSFLTKELKRISSAEYQGMAENPGHLHHEERVTQGVEFYYLR